ncbi:hypothetical protein EC988_010108, partial [Linderina pennispora]
TLCDFDKAIVVEQVVKTPNIPSGTAFFVKIRHCMTWTAGPSNTPPGGWTHYRITFELEWVKSSWIKNAIEKGSVDSNKQAGEQIEKYVREWIAAHPSMEIKAATSISAKPSKASAAKSSRHRKSTRRAKREQSPAGLRMEEVLGEKGTGKKSSGKRRDKSDERELPASTLSKEAEEAALDAKEGEQWKKRASESWAGWAQYHSVYPL